MVRRALDPKRAAWQKPGAVVRALGVRRGQVVAEIGAGPGFFTPRLARAVGRTGQVYAVDPEPQMLEMLRGRLARAGIRNVTPVLGRADDPLLPPGSCDLALIVNAYHHFADGPATLRKIVLALGPGGRVVNIDWGQGKSEIGPPPHRRVPPGKFLVAARRAGLRPVAEHRFLPYQYFFVLRRVRRVRPGRE
jgi:ubiquinone/menaquinone biosynthesis C-methylase UbiE